MRTRTHTHTHTCRRQSLEQHTHFQNSRCLSPSRDQPPGLALLPGREVHSRVLRAPASCPLGSKAPPPVSPGPGTHTPPSCAGTSQCGSPCVPDRSEQLPRAELWVPWESGTQLRHFLGLF
ncbi:hypothetical protein HJG60_011091 [Phyllostomus discolor]|uniref:Uncharacterized protein n=1 Tax=Phyllostomus discolor TaxID=89673 RepID=A0A834A3U4_9CHIR|nr:hypothetical protein HJG60_011091 [Phyllostomus discolor]